MSGADLIGKEVVLKTFPGPEHARGRVIAFTAYPTVVIETESGEHVSWRADLTEVAAPDLPTEPALGWASNRHGPKLGFAGRSGQSPHDSQHGTYHVNYLKGGFDPHELLRSWTPATAVPTEALDSLIQVRDSAVSCVRYERAIIDFLAAVDSANGTAS